jgi:hypothetical protein
MGDPYDEMPHFKPEPAMTELEMLQKQEKIQKMMAQLREAEAALSRPTDEGDLAERLGALSAAATQGAEVYSRELDITNADHIALWLDTSRPLDNAIPWLACRIVEAHEIEIAKLRHTLRTTEAGGGVVETWESINQWCDDTFGPATVPKIIARAKEEFDELETDGADHAIEAADVVICLCRIPGFADALQRKMAINRNRKWRTTGDGTGYHIPALAALGGEA